MGFPPRGFPPPILGGRGGRGGRGGFQGDPSMFLGQGRERDLKIEGGIEDLEQKNPLLNAIEGGKEETEALEEQESVVVPETEIETPITAESEVEPNEGILN